MGKFCGVLIATDFDDTYCAEGDFVHPDNLRLLDYFLSEGGAFTIATGRPHRTFAPLLPLCPVNVPVILSNGAQLYDFEQNAVLAEALLPVSVARDMEELISLYPQLSVETYHGEEVCLWNPNHWSDYHAQKARISPRVCPVRDMPLPWQKAILQNDPQVLLPARRDILDRWGDRYEAIFSNFHMLEITARGCTKGGAVLELARRLGIVRENIYCAGDNQNDIPMLEAAAIPFAPANATDEVRAVPGVRLLPPCRDGAIAQMVRILDEKY